MVGAPWDGRQDERPCTGAGRVNVATPEPRGGASSALPLVCEHRNAAGPSTCPAWAPGRGRACRHSWDAGHAPCLRGVRGITGDGCGVGVGGGVGWGGWVEWGGGGGRAPFWPAVGRPQLVVPAGCASCALGLGYIGKRGRPPAEMRKDARMARCTAPSAPPASSWVTRVMQSRITGLPAPCGAGGHRRGVVGGVGWGGMGGTACSQDWGREVRSSAVPATGLLRAPSAGASSEARGRMPWCCTPHGSARGLSSGRRPGSRRGPAAGTTGVGAHLRRVGAYFLVVKQGNGPHTRLLCSMKGERAERQAGVHKARSGKLQGRRVAGSET